MALDEYLGLDLTHQSSIAQDLFSRAERESRRSSLNLTGDGDAGAVSANLTPEMSSWLGAYVGHRRHAALSAIENSARDVRGAGGLEGVCVEIEEDRLKRDRNTRRTDEARGFYERHQDRIDGLNALQGEYDALREAEGDRDAQVPSRWVEFGLPLMVAIPEGFMNYASFLALTGLGVAGLGMTIVVGLGIGIAAWLAGRFWKAWQFYMRADDDDQQQRGLRMIWIGSSLLTISLAVVGYARYRTVAEKALREIVLGLEPSDPITSTALLLTGNLLVFFVGAAITYIIHDENPLFAQRATRLERDRAAFENIKKRELTGKLEEIEKGYRQRLAGLHKRLPSLATQSEYAKVKEGMGRLSAKDHEVVGLLQSYRGQLVDAIEPRAPDFRFNPGIIERQGGAIGGTIGLAEFAALPLHLYRGVR